MFPWHGSIQLREVQPFSNITSQGSDYLRDEYTQQPFRLPLDVKSEMQLHWGAQCWGHGTGNRLRRGGGFVEGPAKEQTSLRFCSERSVRERLWSGHILC